MSLPLTQGPSAFWLLMKAVLSAKKAGAAFLKFFAAAVLATSILQVAPLKAQEHPRQHSQFSSWSTLSQEPFEHEPILRGASSLAVPFIQLSNKGTLSVDAEVGHRYVFGPSYQDYFRQDTAFANVNVRKTWRYIVVKAGCEALSTQRRSGQRANATPFAQMDFGNWQERHPFQGWAYVSREQYGEGYVGRAAVNQAYRFVVLPSKRISLLWNVGGMAAYGQYARTPWNRQVGVVTGPRIQKEVGEATIIASVEYVCAWRPNGQDGLIRAGVSWWFGKNMKTW